MSLDVQIDSVDDTEKSGI